MRYFARLIKGKTYGVKGITFKKGDPPTQIGSALYSHLSSNPQFEVSIEDEEELEPISVEEIINGGPISKKDVIPSEPKPVKKKPPKERGVFEVDDLGTAIANTPEARMSVEKAKRSKRKRSGV